MRKVLSVLAATTLLAAAPVIAQDFDPIGNYEFETMVDGQTIAGSMTIEGSEGAWAGIIVAEGQGEMLISSVELDGKLMTIYAEVPEVGELIIEVEFDGDEFIGSWSLGFDGGDLVGRKLG